MVDEVKGVVFRCSRGGERVALGWRSPNSGVYTLTLCTCILQQERYKGMLSSPYFSFDSYLLYSFPLKRVAKIGCVHKRLQKRYHALGSVFLRCAAAGGALVHGTNNTWEHLHCLSTRGSISGGGPVSASLAGCRAATTRPQGR